MPTASGPRVKTCTHACTSTEWIHHIVQLPLTCECAACAQPQSCYCCINPILSCQIVHPHCREQEEKKCSFWIRFACSCSNCTCRLPQRLPQASTSCQELVLLSPQHLPLPAPCRFCPRRQVLASRGQCQALKWAMKEGTAPDNRHKCNASQTFTIISGKSQCIALYLGQ